MKIVPVVNRGALLDVAIEMVANNLIVMMPDERGNFGGIHQDSGIGTKITRTQKGAYKVCVFSPEGHTWISFLPGSVGWKKWSELYDLAAEQQENIMAPRLTKLAQQALRSATRSLDTR